MPANEDDVDTEKPAETSWTEAKSCYNFNRDIKRNSLHSALSGNRRKCMEFIYTLKVLSKRACAQPSRPRCLIGASSRSHVKLFHIQTLGKETKKETPL